MIKLAAFSDSHGLLPEIKEPFDLLLIAGDNVDLNYQRNQHDTMSWYITTFVDWVNSLPYKDENSIVLWIAGNHEIGWERLEEGRFEIAKYIQDKTNNRAIYLEDSLYNFNGITIYGTPWCKIFGNWAFMKDQESLNKLYSYIPQDCNILLTHDAPYGTSDMCFDWTKWGRNPEHIGNVALRDAILEKSPKINIHGHLHSSNHNKEILDKTDVYCVSILNEDYKIEYPVLYLDL